MPRIQNSRTCGSGYCLACARRGSGMWSNTSSSDAIRAPSIGFPECHSAPSSRHPWENRTALLVIRCDQLEGFISCAKPPDDPIAVERICDAMNTGFWLGYSLGETNAQAHMRRALGL